MVLECSLDVCFPRTFTNKAVRAKTTAAATTTSLVGAAYVPLPVQQLHRKKGECGKQQQLLLLLLLMWTMPRARCVRRKSNNKNNRAL
jgi:hypothetical protein